MPVLPAGSRRPRRRCRSRNGCDASSFPSDLQSQCIARAGDRTGRSARTLILAHETRRLVAGKRRKRCDTAPHSIPSGVDGGQTTDPVRPIPSDPADARPDGCFEARAFDDRCLLEHRPRVPLPRSILRPVVPEDRDLRVVRGAMPEGISGECFIAAPHPSTLGPPHAFFGAGITYVLSLEPGRRGAAAGSYAWRQAWIDSPSARLQHKRPDVFKPFDARRALAVRTRQRGEHRTAAVGRPAPHDVGRRPACRDRPGVAALPRRGRTRRRNGRRST